MYFAPFWILVLASVPYYTMQPAANWRERFKENPRLFLLCVALIAAYIVCKSQIEAKVANENMRKQNFMFNPTGR
jgi:hypothetical protein